MSVPAFIDISEQEQAAELKVYMKKLGAENISEGNCPGGLFHDLKELVAAAHVIWKENKESDAEAAFNSLLTLMFMLQPEEIQALAPQVCQKLTDLPGSPASAPAHGSEVGDRGGQQGGHLRVRLLQNFLFGLDESNPLAFQVYLALVKLAGERRCLHMVDTGLDAARGLASTWQLSVEQKQQLYRTLHGALAANGRGDEAMRVTLEMLRLCTTEANAEDAKEKARACVIECIKDPECLLFDHLMELKPVQLLSGEDKLWRLLNIFLSGTLADYLALYGEPGLAGYIESLGLSHRDNTRKMRVLTLMTLATGGQQRAAAPRDVTYDQLEADMRLPRDEIEAFVIEVVGTGKVRARIDQLARKVSVQWALPRQFQAGQWTELAGRLGAWRRQLVSVRTNLDQLRNMQLVAPGGATSGAAATAAPAAAAATAQ